MELANIEQKFENWERESSFSSIPSIFQKAFSNGRFSILRILEQNEKVIYIKWKFAGYHSGELSIGCPPTEKNYEFEGSTVFFDSGREIWELPPLKDNPDLNIQTIVQPIQLGKADFGYSLHASSGNQKEPLILALTWIYAKKEDEKKTIRSYSRQIIGEFQETTGFIGIITGFAGLRGFTVSAWESEEALQKGLSKKHVDAKLDFFKKEISPAVWTSVWNPIRLNRIWTRCTVCQHPNDVSLNPEYCEKCEAKLPERKTFW